MKDLVVRPQAHEEMIDAGRYYQSKRANLGIQFLTEVENAFSIIAENPLAWPVLEDDIRKKVLQRFPFSILYKEYSDHIAIIAVMHLRRAPGYWRDRLDDE